MLEALRSSRMERASNNTGKTLHIKSGKPMNMFEASAWAAAFVEFFYGDCAPNLDRPRKVSVRELFDYLASREELEYSLTSDKENPLIPGGCYRAPPQSRWNTPEFMAIFADVVRKILILQTTKPLWTSDAAKWKGDIREIAKCCRGYFVHGFNGWEYSSPKQGHTYGWENPPRKVLKTWLNIQDGFM